MVLLTNVKRDFRVGRCLCCAMLHFEGVSLRKLIGADLYLPSMSKGDESVKTSQTVPMLRKSPKG